MLARAIRGYAEGVLPAQTVATLRGMPFETAEAELREAGVVPAERLIAWVPPAELPDEAVDLAALDAYLEAADPGEDPGQGSGGGTDVSRRPIRELDDGLPPIDTTDLLSPALWS